MRTSKQTGLEAQSRLASLDSSTPQHYEICILAGGQSSRMGRDKSCLRLGRRTVVGHISATANAIGLQPRIIRADLVPRCGPLGGVHTALSTSRAETILFLSCDMPFLSARLLKRLIGRLGRRKKALFIQENGRMGFPFLLRRATLPVVEQRLAARQYSLRKLARALRAQAVSLPRSQAHELFNINTPEDWKVARERWARRPRR